MLRILRTKPSRLAIDITLVLLIKLLALGLIWMLFVRGHDAPVDDRSMETALRFTHFQSFSSGGQHHD